MATLPRAPKAGAQGGSLEGEEDEKAQWAGSHSQGLESSKLSFLCQSLSRFYKMTPPVCTNPATIEHSLSGLNGRHYSLRRKTETKHQKPNDFKKWTSLDFPRSPLSSNSHSQATGLGSTLLCFAFTPWPNAITFFWPLLHWNHVYTHPLWVTTCRI